MSDYNQASENQDSLLGEKEEVFDAEEKIEAPSIKARKKKHIKKNRKKQRLSHKQSKKDAQTVQLRLQAGKVAEELIDKMNQAYNQDLELLKKNKIVNKKLLLSNEIEKELRNIYVCDQFLDLGGLTCFETWLKKNPDGPEPSLTIKKRLFGILLSLGVREEHIGNVGELQKILHKNKRSPTKEIRELSQAIISKWGRISYYDNE